MKWQEYRGYRWCVMPGMCCPSVQVWIGDRKVADIPHDGFDFNVIATRWIDSQLEAGEVER